MKIVLVTGGFDPIHSGHVAYIQEASKLGGPVIVGLNSDAWLERKKGRAFMPWAERATVLSALSDVQRVINFDDSDDSARDAIRKVRAIFPRADIIFANGGDRTHTNIPEMDMRQEMLMLDFVFGVGGDNKVNSSSWILEEWSAPRTERSWGHYRVLHDVSGTKVKELTVMPGQKLSMQRHSLRSEYWHVTHGACNVYSTMPNGYALPVTLLSEHMNHRVPRGEWHQLANPYEVPCKIVEIQFGDACLEDDIERK